MKRYHKFGEVFGGFPKKFRIILATFSIFVHVKRIWLTYLQVCFFPLWGLPPEEVDDLDQFNRDRTGIRMHNPCVERRVPYPTLL